VEPSARSAARTSLEKRVAAQRAIGRSSLTSRSTAV
jgi:hypothetical protein